MLERVFNLSGIDFTVDIESIYNLPTFTDFKKVLERNRNQKQLPGIIKTVEKIPIDLPINDIRRDNFGFHYVSFYMLKQNKFILFDA